MKIKGKRTHVEYVDVDIDPKEILDIIKSNLGFGYDDYISGGVYFVYTGDNHHNGDPEYNQRDATHIEQEKWKAFHMVRDALLKK